jgi:ubiquinone/menaquinone biosynthesis C-methylase UbiE
MDNSKYYETFDWTNFKNADDCLSNLAALIPSDTRTIIDVGCGNGLITNKLSEKYDILGVDRSKAALKMVTCKKLEADCSSLPVEDRSYDLVLSSELLEHLDDDTYQATIREFQRISKKYILISVPFEESLSKGMIQCPECKLLFHRSYHQRRFSVELIQKDFPGFSVISHRSFGLKVRVHNPTLAKLKHKWTKPRNWIPKYWTGNESRQAMCPKCETQFVYPYRFNPIAFSLDVINTIITKKIPFHLAVLLEQKKS